MIEASMAVPPGYALFIPSALRKAVRLPVIGVGRFKDPVQADRALAEGHADLIGVVRGQIADPDFAAKARAGHAEDIRLCLSCNQECVGRMGLGRWLGCIENPRAGREATPIPAPAARPRRVLVAGGGPAGLQAAISAARLGHDVTLYESDDDLGGQVRIAARAPGRAEFGDLIRNQVAECRRAGVAIKTGVAVDVDLVRAERPDVVIVATGARPSRPYWAPAEPVPAEAAAAEPVPAEAAPHGAVPAGDARLAEPGGDGGAAAGDPAGQPGKVPAICDVRDVLAGAAHPHGRVLVVDDLGFHQATGAAEVLADRGCEVELMTSGMVAAQDLGVTLDLETWWLRASRKGIVQTTDTMITGVTAGGVTTQHLATGAAGQRLVDWVVLAVQQAPADDLYFGLKELARAEAAQAGHGPEVHRVGDCLAPRRAHAAVIDGDRVGARL
jgi:2,4-dienoyl-CoA reductase (NADPH2)